MKKKIVAVAPVISLVFTFSTFVSGDTQDVAMNKAEFVNLK